MSHLNGKKPFVDVKYISKNTGRTVTVESSNDTVVKVRDMGRLVELSTITFYSHYRRAPGQAGAKARKAQAEAAAAPRAKQSEFEND